MPDPELPSAPSFAEVFNHVSEIAVRNPYTLWYSTAPELPGVENGSWDVVFYELTDIIDLQGEHHAPSMNGVYEREGEYYWRKWRAGLGPSRAKETVQLYSSPSRRRYQPANANLSVVRPTSIPGLAVQFARRASNESELRLVSDKLADWFQRTEEGATDASRGQLFFAIHNIVAKSTAYADFTHLNEVVNDLQRASETPLGQQMPYWVSMALVKTLIRHDNPNMFTATDLRDIHDSHVARAITAYDEAGLLYDEFWLDAGMRAGAAVINPDFLRLLHDKLSGEDSQKLFESVKDRRALAETYITSVLKQYKTDPTRHGGNIEKLLRDMQPLAGSFRNVDLYRMTSLSNRLAPRISSMYESGTLESEVLATLDAEDITYASDAFLRLLLLTHQRETDATLRATQFEQDILHAEIVALLIAGTRRQYGRG